MGHPAHLGQPACLVRPVVEAQDRQRRVEGADGEGQLLGDTTNDGARAPRPLGDHDRRRLDRDHVPVERFVRARAGSDVDDPVGVAQGGVDLPSDTRIRATVAGVERPMSS